MRLWQSKPIWLNSDSFLPNNNVNPSISYYIYKVAFLYTKPKNMAQTFVCAMFFITEIQELRGGKSAKSIADKTAYIRCFPCAASNENPC